MEDETMELGRLTIVPSWMKLADVVKDFYGTKAPDFVACILEQTTTGELVMLLDGAIRERGQLSRQNAALLEGEVARLRNAQSRHEPRLKSIRRIKTARREKWIKDCKLSKFL